MRRGGSGGSRAGRTARIALNGRYLDEVRVRLDSSRTSFLTLPEGQHRAIADGDAFVLRLPALTALQLYHEGVLSAADARPVELRVGDEPRGTFTIEWLRRDANARGDHERVKLRLVPALLSAAAGDRSWAEGLVPLRLEARGTWDPEEEYWGEEGEPIEDWAKPIIARGPRPMFEMEQVLPGSDPDDPDADPILEANALRDIGRTADARRLLMRLIEQDPRCLDAHAHLGNMVFDRSPQRALAHYALGVQIARRTLREHFDGVLPWGLIDNRPFLRCLHGLALCLWRLARFEEAQQTLEQLLWLSPADELGARFLLPQVRGRSKWTREE